MLYRKSVQSEGEAQVIHDRLVASMRLYAVTDTDRRFLKEGDTLCSQVEQALIGGATFIQLREKNMNRDALLAEAKEIRALTERYGVPFVINDDVEMALLCGADGVHVGQDDMDAESARRLLGPDRLLGVSVHNVQEALRAEKSGADYLGAGAVFSTSTKEGTSALAMETLREICAAVHIPVVAIGGITEQNILQLAGSGISGAAVVSAVFGAKDIATATRRLVSAAKLACLFNGRKAAIFDMDGTLLDSMGMWGTLDVQYMNGLGIEPDADFHRNVSAMMLPEAAEYICEKYAVPYTPAQVVEQFTGMVEGYYRDSLLLKRGMAELVRALHGAGIKMAVATANEYDMSRAALERNEIMPYMVEDLVTCAMAGAGKGSPAVYLMACDMMQVDVSECVVFEDSLFAVRTAADAGFAVVGVYEEIQKNDWKEICALTDCQVVSG